jgi:hypothetical protein
MAEHAEVKKRTKELGRLWWLVDAPLFIDRDLVGRLHDAIVWPEFSEETRSTERFKKISGSGELGAEAEAEGELAPPDFLKWIGPKLKAKAKIAAKGVLARESGSTTAESGRVVDNPERRLNELVLEYLEEFPDRVVFVDVPGGTYTNHRGMLSEAQISELLQSPPRPLVFMDIQPKSPIFPTMIEMENGVFKPVFETLDPKLLKGLNPAPKYDDDSSKRKEYWAAIEQNFRSRIAMEEVEKACSEGRIGWIDFRLLFKRDGATAHLHIVPGGRSYAGVFAYNFIHRGYKHGCRVVGSLKSGNDVNVLAIYER